MNTTPELILIFQTGLRQEKSTSCGLSINWFTSFLSLPRWWMGWS